MSGEPLSDCVQVAFAGSHGHGEIVKFFGRYLPTIYDTKYKCSTQPRALIPILEDVVANDGVHIKSRLIGDSRINCFSKHFSFYSLNKIEQRLGME